MSAKATRTIALSSTELESAIEVLSSAGEELQLTRFERLSYRALMASVDVIAAVVTVVFAKSSIDGFSGRVVELPPAFYVVLGLFVIVGILVGIVTLALNIPLFLKAIRERARLKELGLSSLSKRLWKESRRSRWTSRLRGALLIVAGIILLYVGVFVFFSERYERDAGTIIFTVLLFSVGGIVLFSARYLRNQRERMDLTASAEALKKALESLRRYADKAGVVSVPSELLEQTAKIESVQIAEQRKDAVLQSAVFRSNAYAVAFDRDATKQRAGLGVGDRVELEDLLAQLSIDGAQLEPQAGAVVDAKGATL